MARPRRFADVLRAVDPARLRTAFAASSEADPDGGYDRTTLNRWLDGAVPNRGGFIRLLADELDNPELYEAWEESREERSSSLAKSVVSRFESLGDDEDRDEAFHAIREDYISRGRPERRNMNYRITVNDPMDDQTDHLLLRLDIAWEGRLPADASVVIVTDHAGLGDAYNQSNCVFRDVVDFDPDRLATILAEQVDDQVLAYNPLGATNPQAVTHQARVNENGKAEFGNIEVERARVKLSLSYPIPSGTTSFPIQFGQYSVPGPAEFSLILNSRRTTRPRAFAYMAPGRQREWAANPFRANELFTSLGTAETVMGEGDGVVLSWSLV